MSNIELTANLGNKMVILYFYILQKKRIVSINEKNLIVIILLNSKWFIYVSQVTDFKIYLQWH